MTQKLRRNGLKRRGTKIGSQPNIAEFVQFILMATLSQQISSDESLKKLYRVAKAVVSSQLDATCGRDVRARPLTPKTNGVLRGRRAMLPDVQNLISPNFYIKVA